MEHPGSASWYSSCIPKRPLPPPHLWRYGNYRYTFMYRQGAYEEKKKFVRNLVLMSSLSQKMWKRLGAYMYNTWAVPRERAWLLNFWYQTPSFLILNSETGFWSLKSQGLLKWPKVVPVRLVSLLTPPPPLLWLYNTFDFVMCVSWNYVRLNDVRKL